MPSGIYIRIHKRSWKVKDTSRMKGKNPWNKGTKGICKPNSGSFKKGEPNPGFQKGNKLGCIKWTLEMRKNARKGAMKRVREGRHNWYKGGITKEDEKIRKSIEFRLWREAVFARDNWTCRKYGIGGEINAHHIQNFAQFPELRFAIDNGITLSIKAHREFHKIYGKSNNTKEQLDEYIKNN